MWSGPLCSTYSHSPFLSIHPSFLFSNSTAPTFFLLFVHYKSKLDKTRALIHLSCLASPEGMRSRLTLSRRGGGWGAAIKITLYHCKVIPVSPLCLLKVTLSCPACHPPTPLHTLTFLQHIFIVNSRRVCQRGNVVKMLHGMNITHWPAGDYGPLLMVTWSLSSLQHLV